MAEVVADRVVGQGIDAGDGSGVRVRDPHGAGSRDDGPGQLPGLDVADDRPAVVQLPDPAALLECHPQVPAGERRVLDHVAADLPRGERVAGRRIEPPEPVGIALDRPELLAVARQQRGREAGGALELAGEDDPVGGRVDAGDALRGSVRRPDPVLRDRDPAAVCGWFSSAVGFGSAIRAGAPGARGSIRRTLVPSESEAQIEPYPTEGATWLGFSSAIAARPMIAPVAGIDRRDQAAVEVEPVEGVLTADDLLELAAGIDAALDLPVRRLEGDDRLRSGTSRRSRPRRRDRRPGRPRQRRDRRGRRGAVRSRAERRPLQRARDLAPRGAFGRMDLDDSDRLLEPLEPLDPPEAERDTLRRPGELADRVGRQHLAGPRERAQPRGAVERAAAEAAFDRDRLAGVEPDPDRPRRAPRPRRRAGARARSAAPAAPSRTRRAPRRRAAPAACRRARAQAARRSPRTVAPARRRPRRRARACTPCSRGRRRTGTCGARRRGASGCRRGGASP